MDPAENEQGDRIIGAEAQSGVNSTEQSSVDAGESTEIGDIHEALKPKWEHDKRVSNDKMLELLTILKESVEKSIKQTEEEIKHYRSTLNGFKP